MGFLYPAGLRRCHRRAWHTEWRIVQRQYTNHAAIERQLDSKFPFLLFLLLFLHNNIFLALEKIGWAKQRVVRFKSLITVSFLSFGLLTTQSRERNQRSPKNEPHPQSSPSAWHHPKSSLFCDQHFDHLIHDIQFDPLFLYLGHRSLFGCCCSAVSADKQVGALKCDGRVHACFGVGLPAELVPESKHFLGFSSRETCSKQF